jgi:hypothetical protein
VDEPDAGRCGCFQQRCMQVCPAHPAPGSRSERCVDVTVGPQVADTAEGPAPWLDSEALQMPDGVRHQSFATSLVDWSATLLDDDHLEPCPRCVQSGCKPRGAAAGNK